jgi:hypothetical protein
MTEVPYIHPAFPQPADRNETLWRYVDAVKFEWLLATGRLFMPTADKLGDPFEGTTRTGSLNGGTERRPTPIRTSNAASLSTTVLPSRGWLKCFATSTITLAVGI